MSEHENALKNILRMAQDTRMTCSDPYQIGLTDPMVQMRNIIAYCKTVLGLPPNQDFIG